MQGKYRSPLSMYSEWGVGLSSTLQVSAHTKLWETIIDDIAQMCIQDQQWDPIRVAKWESIEQDIAKQACARIRPEWDPYMAFDLGLEGARSLLKELCRSKTRKSTPCC